MAHWKVLKSLVPPHKQATAFIVNYQKYCFSVEILHCWEKCKFRWNRNWKSTRKFIFQLKTKCLHIHFLCICYIAYIHTQRSWSCSKALLTFEAYYICSDDACFPIQLVGKFRYFWELLLILDKFRCSWFDSLFPLTPNNLHSCVKYSKLIGINPHQHPVNLSPFAQFFNSGKA